jgi:hypothetical protein
MTIIDVFIYYETQRGDIVLKILRGITTIRYSIQDNKLYKYTNVITLKIYVGADENINDCHNIDTSSLFHLIRCMKTMEEK